MQLKKLVNDAPLWKAFCEKLDLRIEFHRKGMESAVSDVDLRKHQGAIRELRVLLSLRKEINGVDIDNG